MIRTHAVANTSGIDATIALLDDHAKIVAAAGQRAYDRVAPQALAELRQEPPPTKQPVEWESDKQRIAVMIKYRKKGITQWQRGQNGPRLSEQWEAVAKIEGKIFRITFENRSPIAKYVYGSLAQNVAAAKRFQQKFHHNTGWQLATETATKWTTAMIAEFRKEFRQEITVRRRAYTQGRRRAA